MQAIEKRPYEKPVLEVYGSMIERTLCDPPDDGSTGVPTGIPGNDPYPGFVGTPVGRRQRHPRRFW